MPPSELRLSFRRLVAIVLVQLLALTLHAWLSRSLLANGYGELQAHHIAYLAVPPLLLLLLAPVLLEHRHFLKQLFGLRHLSLRLVLAAAALGVAMRVAWWAQLIARVSFGATTGNGSQGLTGPVLTIACPPLQALSLAILAMVVLVPLVEETIHRGLLQSAFVHLGPVRSIMISALVFSVFHPPSSYFFVLPMGVILGVQFWLTRSLWATILTHASYNGLAQLDWHCLHGQWNPPPESLPQVAPGATALLVLMAMFPLMLVLLRNQRAGAPAAPAAPLT